MESIFHTKGSDLQRELKISNGAVARWIEEKEGTKKGQFLIRHWKNLWFLIYPWKFWSSLLAIACNFYALLAIVGVKWFEKRHVYPLLVEQDY
jgi:hypothetical protein